MRSRRVGAAHHLVKCKTNWWAVPTLRESAYSSLMPSPHRVLAIGDIHGCSRAFDALLGTISLSADDLLITLGDYVGRGPDTLGVLNRLVRLSQSAHLVALRGNHEEMMMKARQSAESLLRWKSNGGDAALGSYSPGDDEGRLADVP